MSLNASALLAFPELPAGGLSKQVIFQNAISYLLAYQPTNHRKSQSGLKAAVRRKTMGDRMIILLNENWSLRYDRLQWKICKRKKRGDKPYWQAVSFIATEKWILERNLRELGIQIDPEAQADLDALPDTFKQWYQTNDVEFKRIGDTDKGDSE